jgi:predicted transcriptional regulator
MFPSNIDKNSRTKIKSGENVENKRRDRLHIIAEILNITKDGSLKTQIMYKANLSFAQLNEYLNFLTKIELIKINKEKNKTIYRITDKGQNYLEKYKDISEILGNNDL